MRFAHTLLFCAASVPLLTLSGVAGAQSSGDISNRLSRIENELDTMSRAVYKGEKPPVSAMGSSGNDAADTLVRVQQLESQIQTLTGKIEEQGFEITQLKNKIDRMTSDYELRLKDIESRQGGSGANVPGSSPYAQPGGSAADSGSSWGAASDSASSSAATGGAGYQFSTNNVAGASGSAASGAGDVISSPAAQANTLGTLTEGSGAAGVAAPGDASAMAYENAFSLLKAGNYEAAQKGFDDFLQKNPDHVLAGNAKYWLGETYYARANYEKAARIFAEAYQKYPDGSKAADNLLKLGMSLSATGNNSDACTAFRQLEKNYKTGAEPVLRRAQQEMSKLGC